MMLASAPPDRVGALVLNGAPLSYWAGERGKNPMRYLGGLAGGSWPALLLADLGNGKFDGANLVMNFESLSPGNTWFRKYADIYLKADTEAERFLEFERWWGGFFLMNREEIRWIVGNLFIGNRFSAGQLAAIAPLAETVRADRRKAAPDNPFLAFERQWVETTERIFDAWRDARDAAIAWVFHAVYAALAVWGIGSGDEAAEADAARELVASRTPLLEEVRGKIDRGGYPEAVVRMMVLLADSRSAVRRSRLSRSNALLTGEAPFAAMSARRGRR